MNDETFMGILKQLEKYLATEKKFIVNTFRETEFKKAIELACKLFPDAKIYTNDDPLQMGAMILCIEDYNISAAGETEINLFSDIIALADNFEFYSLSNGDVKFAAVFQNVLVRI
ncbi:MAG: hypothetical protein IJD89_00495 [Clostridia bacterium]|nr:hypothetical protein [Clostridia bacterium]